MTHLENLSPLERRSRRYSKRKLRDKLSLYTAYYNLKDDFEDIQTEKIITIYCLLQFERRDAKKLGCKEGVQEPNNLI